ncbi:XRE family transcriptional regulator [Actinomadura darangshiensis]|uniref:XRE family transcriptional regulator n=1 Tax=Actinomadura darangshiensis TaxID=705336 RepID=A0A4V2YWI8_9ACTN|nr:helix-turn-helix transcriptional regulator [Actinomadura darangshiensis]TDD85587.1 XRE family transcriptional regulator [Actinomadura darangshiensis]
MTPRRRLAVARKRASHTQVSLAEEIGVDKTTVSRWERGATEITDRHRPRLAAALTISLAELDRLLDPSAGHGPSAPVAFARLPSGDADAAGGYSAHRSALFHTAGLPAEPPTALQAPGAGSTGTPISVDPVETLRVSLDRAVRAADTVDLVEDWRLTAYEYACSVRIGPPQAFIRDIGTDIVDLGKAIDACGPDLDIAAEGSADHVALLRVSAQLSALMAMALTEVGELAAASRWWRTARRIARAGGDPVLRAWVCGRQAMAAQAIGLTSLALRVADQARELAGGVPCAGSADAGAARALSLATSGSPALTRLALTELAALDDLFERLPEDVRGEEQAVWGWPAQRLRSTRTAVLAALGDGTVRTDLRGELRAELDHLEPVSIRERAEVELKTSMVLIRSGQTHQGLDAATAAFAGLPPEHRTVTLAGLARRVYRCVPDRDRDRAAAQALQAHIGQYWR